ncbi:MAG: DUF3326 domain-containing protein [Planctomycetes bacterium]|nr:DUF3326 domain-containing protein [Planctomycetota bacterium]
MLLSEHEIRIPKLCGHTGLLQHLAKAVQDQMAEDSVPVRIAVTKADTDEYVLELGTLSGLAESSFYPTCSIFDSARRQYEHTDQFNAVLVIPTGIGAELGGHSGDAGPVARLVAQACDTLITHPNVVNASDINELPRNGLYVEGSVISRFLLGNVGLGRVRSNRVLMVMDEHEYAFFHEAAINSVSAARAALGMDCPLVIKMKDKLLMRSLYSRSGRAAGSIEFLERLCEILYRYRDQYDAVALSSVIQLPSHFHSDYFRDDRYDMVNPWGGVEAMLTHAVSMLFNVPSAHSPMISSKEVLDLDVGIVDPRKSAETVSTTYLHCILKGLHRSPRLIPNAPIHSSPGLLTVADVSCLIIPDGCIGLPTLAALEQNIPVIAVRNKNCMGHTLADLPFGRGRLYTVDNYLEAVGVMTALRSGVALESVRRPMPSTRVITQAIKTLPGMPANRPSTSTIHD